MRTFEVKQSFGPPVTVTDIGADHEGWNNFRYTQFGCTWRLLTIDHDDDKSSHIICEKIGTENIYLWRNYNTIVLPVVLNVEAALEIITQISFQHTRSFNKGESSTRQKIREAIGV